MTIDADDLAMLATSFEAAMTGSAATEAVDAALVELGWFDALVESPVQVAAAAFDALGRTNSASTLLDDVLVHALGEQAGETCVVMPRAHSTEPPGTAHGQLVRIDGVVSCRVERVVTAIVPIEGGLAVVEAAALRRAGHGLDPAHPLRAVAVEVPAISQSDGTSWLAAVAAAQGALAHQLIGASRSMLELARVHAIDRVQFGRSIASFQAVRHKLAETLVAIEAAVSVADELADDDDPLLAMLAKSLAGTAARTASRHCQQVLAGIGFTTDHTFHQFMKRALILDTLFGSAKSLPELIGRELLRRQEAPRLVEL